MLNFKAYPRHSINIDKELFKDIIDVIFRRQILDGPYIKAFEEGFSQYIGAKYAISVSSARKGLYLILKNLNFNQNDEITMPSYTFRALPLTALACGLKPVFVDVYSDTYNINPTLIEANITEKTKAILITHMFGQPCDMDSIIKIAQRHNLVIIEDCAHACGAKYKGQRVGSFGDAAIFSFKMGKNLPCFGGGMVTTDSDFLYRSIKKLVTNFPYPKVKKIFKEIFSTFCFYWATRKEIFPFLTYPIIFLLDLFNLDTIDRHVEEVIDAAEYMSSIKKQTKFTNLQAAVGIKQLARLDIFNGKLRNNAQLLAKELMNIKNISVPSLLPNAESTHLYFRIKVENRRRFRRKLIRRGVDTKRDDISACSRLEIFQEYKTKCPISEELPKKCIEIPNNPSFDKEDILYIAEQVRKVAEGINL